jgi:hypothetical protein
MGIEGANPLVKAISLKHNAEMFSLGVVFILAILQL